MKLVRVFLKKNDIGLSLLKDHREMKNKTFF